MLTYAALGSSAHSPKQRDRRSLTLSIDLPLGASSNFPSPSSTFLPPPIPGAEEFAIKKPPRGRSSRKTSVVAALVGSDSEQIPRPHADPSLSPMKTNSSGKSPSSNKPQSIPSLPSSSPIFASVIMPADSLPHASLAVHGTSPSDSVLHSVSPSPTTPTPRAPSGTTDASHPSPSPIVVAFPAAATPTNSYPPNVYPPTQRTGSDPATVWPSGPMSSSSTKRMSTQSVFSSASSPPQSPSAQSFRPSKISSHATPVTPTKLYHLPKNESTSSLLSNRPAPASPAISRRTSGVSPPHAVPVELLHRQSENDLQNSQLTRSFSTSSKASRKRTSQQSGASKSSSSAKDVDCQGGDKGMTLRGGHKRPSSISTALLTPTTATATATLNWNPIIVKDFAYAEDDERGKGLGQDCPKPNRLRLLNKPLYINRASFMSAMTTASSSTSSRFTFEVGEDGGPPKGSGHDAQPGVDTVGSKLGISGFDIPGFKWGRWSWALRRDVEEATQHSHYSEDVDDEADEDDQGGLLGVEEPLYPGLYKALYAFDPESGSAEMALEEGQIVRVVGRGGGPGWVVVVASTEEESTGDEGEGPREKHALVPESYLEVVELDEWEEDDSQGED